VRARRLTTRAIQTIVAARAKRAGITMPVTPHTLRHCFVSHLLERGADSPSIQKMVGHDHLATTQHYAHLSPAFLIAQAKRGAGWSRPGA
jgi:integrase/recombinase XerD